MESLPEHARVYGTEQTVCEPAGYEEFLILESDPASGGVPIMLPDLAPCHAPGCATRLPGAIIILLPTVPIAVPVIPLLSPCLMTAPEPA